MPAPDRRVIVDHVDWTSVLLFPKITRAFGLSLRPARVLMGLAVVVVLMVSGTLWDALAGPRVGPAGLGTAPLDERSARLVLNPIVENPRLVDSVLATQIAADERVEPREVREALIETYHDLNDEAQAQRWDEFQSALNVVETVAPRGVFEATVDYLVDHARSVVAAALRLDARGALTESIASPAALPRLLWARHPWFVIVFGAWSLLVWAVGKGTIARSAACEFAAEQFIPWTAALAFALKRWIPLVGTFVLPLIALLLGALALAVGGLLFAVPGLDVLGAVLYGLALFGSFFAALILVLGAPSACLFIPAVAVESADAPDALARGFSYVKNRPLHWLAYSLLAFLQGAAGLVLAMLLAALTIDFAAWGASLFVDTPAMHYAGGATVISLAPEDTVWAFEGTRRAAAGLLSIWRTLVAGLVAGWLVAYWTCASTVVYFLLRKATDDQNLDEIWQPGMVEGTMAPSRAVVPPLEAGA